MHEMSLCESILQILEDNAKKQGFAKVKTVWLEIGCLSGVEMEAMRFSFDAVTRGTQGRPARGWGGANHVLTRVCVDVRLTGVHVHLIGRWANSPGSTCFKCCRMAHLEGELACGGPTDEAVG